MRGKHRSEEGRGLSRAVARLYARFGFWRQLYARFRVGLSGFEQIEGYLPRTGRILDLGCGYGVLANYLALACPDRSVVGIDRDEGRIRIARETIDGRTNATFIVGDVTDMSLPECAVVLMNDFLHHLEPIEQERFLARLREAVPRDSMLLIQEVNTRPLWKYLFSYLSDMVLYCFQGGHFRSPESWVGLLSATGFRDIRVLPGDAGTVFARISYIAHA